jgi:hypothetical protein
MAIAQNGEEINIGNVKRSVYTCILHGYLFNTKHFEEKMMIKYILLLTIFSKILSQIPIIHHISNIKLALAITMME